VLVTGIRSLLLVGAGGFVGSVARYVFGTWVHAALPRLAFPVGTLAVNTSGCFLIGIVAALLETRQLTSPAVRLFLMVGVLGGFTTFSSFAAETLALANNALVAKVILNVAAQVLLGLSAAWLGYSVCK
jgi:CrcB protein